MKKFLAVVKHEYKKIVFKWTFLLGTLLLPLLAVVFSIVPMILFTIKGEPTKIVVVDRDGKGAKRLRENLTAEKLAEKSAQAAKDAQFEISRSQNDQLQQNAKNAASGFVFVDYFPGSKTDEQIREELRALAVDKQIDAYLLVPADDKAQFEFVSRKGGDFIAGSIIDDALNDAIRSERLAKANIDEKTLTAINQKVKLTKKSIDDEGREKDSDMLLAASFVIGMMIYITLAIYGQMILGAVVEEKETRIAEILFSSATPFELMLGKLAGVGLAGLTQLGIWVSSVAALVAFVAVQSDLSPFLAGMPTVTPVMILLFLIYFLLGYFAFASLFALIGSVVTTVQEGGQFSFPVIMTMLVGFYFSFAVIRDPNSSLSFWVSIAPFFAPMTMPVRILAATPPWWEIVLSVGINALAIVFLVWVASRVYRIGMLMYGKRATIPEIWRWFRQA
ncbi:MAG TPA: ABC transporter permease [Pyrinomonadaceae bacterium]|nr:ABC transporter permease [Pyrinomonadaceae bacterium]